MKLTSLMTFGANTLMLFPCRLLHVRRTADRHTVKTEGTAKSHLPFHFLHGAYLPAVGLQSERSGERPGNSAGLYPAAPDG